MNFLGLSFRTNIVTALSASKVWCQQSRLATKKAGGSSRNGRDSDGRRLGVRKFGGEEVKNGTLIILQRGQKYHAGDCCRMARDHTIYSLTEGHVAFKYDKKTKINTVFVTESSPNEPRATERKEWTESLTTRLRKRKEEQVLQAQAAAAEKKEAVRLSHGVPL